MIKEIFLEMGWDDHLVEVKLELLAVRSFHLHGSHLTHAFAVSSWICTLTNIAANVQSALRKWVTSSLCQDVIVRIITPAVIIPRILALTLGRRVYVFIHIYISISISMSRDFG